MQVSLHQIVLYWNLPAMPFIPQFDTNESHKRTWGMPWTQCEVLDVGKYSNPSFGPFSQVFGSVPGFFLAS